MYTKKKLNKRDKKWKTPATDGTREDAMDRETDINASLLETILNLLRTSHIFPPF
jgi:hypothetical protein